MRKSIVIAAAALLSVPGAVFATHAGASDRPAAVAVALDGASAGAVGQGGPVGQGGQGGQDLGPAAIPAELSLGNLHLYGAPVRTYDSRPASGLLGSGTGPIANTTRRVAIRVPSTAIAAEVNLTATNTSAFGFMRAFGIDVVPSHSNLNWNAPGQAMANQITVPLTLAGVAQAGCTTQCLFEFNVETAGSADVVIDVIGYYNP